MAHPSVVKTGQYLKYDAVRQPKKPALTLRGSDYSLEILILSDPDWWHHMIRLKRLGPMNLQSVIVTPYMTWGDGMDFMLRSSDIRPLQLDHLSNDYIYRDMGKFSFRDKQFLYLFDADFLKSEPLQPGGTTENEGRLEKKIEVGVGGESLKGKDQARTRPAVIESPCLKALSQDFGKLLDAESGHDVVLKCGDRTLRAHKSVLASRSKVFEGTLQSDMVEGRTGQVEVKDMDSDAFLEFVKYLYTGTLPKLTEDKAKKLYEAGDRYAVESLMRRCVEFLSMSLTVQNACEYLVLADAHSDSDFKEKVVTFILEKKIPLMDDHWRAFSTRCPLVAVEVLNRFCKLHITA